MSEEYKMQRIKEYLIFHIKDSKEQRELLDYLDKLQQKENIIKEVREYIEEHKQKGYRIPMSDDYEFWNELNENEIKILLGILDKGE